jgi:hypothetical protein
LVWLDASQKGRREMNTGVFLVCIALLAVGIGVHIGIKRGWIK